MGLGEIFTKALVNTLIGMGTVFVVLLFIAFIIALMPVVVNAITGAGKKKAEEVSATVKEAAPIAVPSEEVEEEIDDLELVAVIVAAIAASEGVSPDGFVVRSVRKSNQNKWKRV